MTKLRFIPTGGALVEVTTRTQHGRLLLRPHPELNEIVCGILARAQRLYLSEGAGGAGGAGLCAFCFLSNHFHLLVRVRNAKELASFMRYVNSNLAREVARRVDWRDHVWSRRYQAIVVSEEPEAQEARLRYLLSQGVKEGLVAHPSEWPGASSVQTLLDGKDSPIEGLWFDRTKEYFARRRREDFHRLAYATKESLSLLPLPCWEDLGVVERRGRVAQMVEEIVAEALLRRGRREPLGIALVLRQQPHERPVHCKRSPAPRFHAATREARRELYQSFRRFARAYRLAALTHRVSTDPGTCPYPQGCFPPAPPFVGEGSGSPL
jgi:REP element-mobilizing transposase RayT